VMHTSPVYSPRYSASRVFFCLETASPYSSPTRLTRLLPQLIFHCATVFYAPRRHSRLLARRPQSPTTLDSPRARHAASCASLDSSGVVFCILIVAGRPLVALGEQFENGISACVSNIFIRLSTVMFRAIVCPYDIPPVFSVDLLMV
jgi:hypothetical protein